ncbi:hypothetical protein DRO59_09305, partial [Candidatus Bathyarchaeota archaeon]
MPLHKDFQKILNAFKKRYGEKEGERLFWAWVNKLGLNPDKPYRKPQEKFNWAKSAFQYIKQDKNAKYYKVEALFPLTSMNNNVYTEDELVRAARTLIGKPVNLNHEDHTLKGVKIVDAEYEDGAVEVLLRVLKTAGRGLGVNICDMIDKGEILNVSVEASCRNISLQPVDGEVVRKCEGLVFTGLALLTKDVLPGVPLTRIMPVERLVESFTVKGERKMNEKEKQEKEGSETVEAEVVGENVMVETETEEVKEAKWDTAYINSLPDSCFAVIEPAYKRGETKDKRARHLPYKDKDGKIDLPHLRNALARMDQIKPVTDSITADELRAQARKVLIPLAKKYLPNSQWAQGERVDEHGKAETEKAKAEACEEEGNGSDKVRESLEKTVKMLEAQIEKQQAKIQELTKEKQELEEKLRKAK